MIQCTSLTPWYSQVNSMSFWFCNLFFSVVWNYNSVYVMQKTSSFKPVPSDWWLSLRIIICWMNYKEFMKNARGECKREGAMIESQFPAGKNAILSKSLWLHFLLTAYKTGQLSLMGFWCLFVSKKMPNNAVISQSSIVAGCHSGLLCSQEGAGFNPWLENNLLVDF